MTKIKYGFPGEKRNSLTVIKEIEPTPSGVRRLLCKCDCGNTRVVNVYKFNNGEIKRCKECDEKIRQQNLIDKYSYMIGKMYGKLRVEDIYRGEKRIMAHCTCKCGNKVDVIVTSLLNSNTKSCGCYEKEVLSRQRHFNTYNLDNEYGIGYLDDGTEFYFDKEDYDLIRQYSWNSSPNQKPRYLRTKKVIDGKVKNIMMHRLVMGVLDNPDVEVDHIKHNTLDNRKSQLRIGTKWDNNLNHDLFVTNKSGCSGVQWDKKNNKWYATISYGGEHYWLGYYINKEDAIKVRKEAENYYFKDWSFDNSMNADLSEEVID